MLLRWVLLTRTWGTHPFLTGRFWRYVTYVVSASEEPPIASRAT
jgi:hypothetical protein